jgi:hypothetical protein
VFDDTCTVTVRRNWVVSHTIAIKIPFRLQTDQPKLTSTDNDLRLFKLLRGTEIRLILRTLARQLLRNAYRGCAARHVVDCKRYQFDKL